MAFTAKHRFARIAPRKARLIMDLIRGRDVDDAINMLKFAKQRARMRTGFSRGSTARKRPG